MSEDNEDQKAPGMLTSLGADDGGSDIQAVSWGVGDPCGFDVHQKLNEVEDRIGIERLIIKGLD